MRDKSLKVLPLTPALSPKGEGAYFTTILIFSDMMAGSCGT